MGGLGVLIHEQFPFGAIGPRQWSLSEMKRLLRWFKGMGWNKAIFLLWPVYDEEDKFNILEHTALYGSGVRPRTVMRPLNDYGPSDRCLGNEEGMARSERLKAMMIYAKEIGLRPWVILNTTHGAPQFCEEHPELMAIDAFDFSAEGVVLCPSKPEALAHLLEHHAELLRYLEVVEGVLMTFRDGGGCNCSLCQPQGKMMARLAAAYNGMIRGIYPDIPVVFASHHIHISDVPDIAPDLPQDIWVAESMRIQSLDVPPEEDIKRVSIWREHGFRILGAMAVQENPTACLPSIFPNRIDRAVRLARELKMEGLWVGSTLNPYVFPMHWWMLPKLWNGEAPARDLMERYFTESFGADSVESGLRWAAAMEGALDHAQAQSQRDAGFQKMLVINFAARMLPERCMQNGVPDHFRRDMEEAVRLAREALEAAEEFADRMREFHALDANTIVAGTEVLTRYLEMRQAKIPVLDALHEGDAVAAVRAFGAVEEYCRQMVAACRNAPNTDVLARHWRRLELLPERLASLKKLLPELAEKKRFKPVMIPLEMADQTWMKKANAG